jgi:hypothetical protein
MFGLRASAEVTKEIVLALEGGKFVTQLRKVSSALFGQLQLLRSEKLRLLDRFRRSCRRQFVLLDNLQAKFNFCPATLNAKWIVLVHWVNGERRCLIETSVKRLNIESKHSQRHMPV